MDIRYTSLIPNADDLYEIYEHEGWNGFLKLPKEVLHQAMEESWYTISAYNEKQLIGTGRIISDGLINAYLCGLIVHPDFRNRGVGKEIIKKLIEKSKEANLSVELFCEEKNIAYYEKAGFEKFAVGLKYKL